MAQVAFDIRSSCIERFAKLPLQHPQGMQPGWIMAAMSQASILLLRRRYQLQLMSAGNTVQGIAVEIAVTQQVSCHLGWQSSY